MFTEDDIETSYYQGMQDERERIVELIEIWLNDDAVDFDDIYSQIIN